MAYLSVVELHRTASGGWELVNGGAKPLDAAPETGGPPLEQRVHVTPLPALFAECLQENSQLSAEFEVTPYLPEPPCPATLGSPAAGKRDCVPPPAACNPLPERGVERQQSALLPPQQPLAQLGVEDVLTGSDTQPDFPLSRQLARRQSQVPDTPSDQRQHPCQAAGQGGASAAVGPPAEAPSPADAIPCSPLWPAAPTLPDTEAATPLLSPPEQPSSRTAAAAVPDTGQPLAAMQRCPGSAPQRLLFVPETAAEGLPPAWCVPATAVDPLAALVPETAAKHGLLVAPATAARQRPLFAPETAEALPGSCPRTAAAGQLQYVSDSLQAELTLAVRQQPDFVPDTAAGWVDAPHAGAAQPPFPAAGAGQQRLHLIPQALQFVPETAAELQPPPQPLHCVEETAAELLPSDPPQPLHFVPAAAPLPPSHVQQPQQDAATVGLEPTVQLPPAVEADGLEAAHAHCLPGPTPGACRADQLPAYGAPPGAMPPPPPRTAAPRGGQAPPQPGMPPSGGCAGGLGDFDVTVEAPAAGACADACPSSGFDYDVGCSHGSPTQSPPRGPPPPHRQQPHRGWAGPGQPHPLQQPSLGVLGNAAPSHSLQPTPPWRQQQQLQAAPQSTLQQPGQQPAHLAPPAPASSAPGGALLGAAYPTRLLFSSASALPPQQAGHAAPAQPQHQCLEAAAQAGAPRPLGLHAEQGPPAARRRVSLLQREPGSFKPVRPGGAAAGPATRGGPGGGGSAACRPPSAPAVAEKRRFVSSLQAELAAILEVDPDAAPPRQAGFAPCTALQAGGGPGCQRTPPGPSGEDAAAKKARVMAALMADLGGGGASRPAGQQPPPPLLQQQQQQQQQHPPLAPVAQAARHSWQGFGPAGPAAQQPPWQPGGRQEAAGVPRQAAQRAQQAAAAPRDHGDVMADVAPGAFVSASSKATWRLPAKSGGGNAARLAALVRELESDGGQAVSGQGLPHPPALANVQLPAPMQCQQQQQQQQQQQEQAGAAVGPASPGVSTAAGHAQEAGAALQQWSVEDMSLEAARQLQEAQTAAQDRVQREPGQQQQARREAEQPQPAQPGHAAQPALPAGEAASPQQEPAEGSPAPLSGSKRGRGGDAGQQGGAKGRDEAGEQPPSSRRRHSPCSAALGEAAAADGGPEQRPHLAAPAAPLPPPGGHRVAVLGFTTGRGAAVTVDAAALQAAQQRLRSSSPDGGPAQQAPVPLLAPLQQGQHPAAPAHQPAPSDSVALPGFSTGRGAAVAVDAARLAAARQLLGGWGSDGGGGSQEGSPEQQEGVGAPAGGEQPALQQEAAAAAGGSPQAQLLGFSTGRGGSVAVSAARLEAARQQMGGGGGAENADANQPQQGAGPPAGDSTPLLRKQLLKTRASLGGAGTPGAATGAARVGGGAGEAALAGVAAGASTTPASVPAVGKTAALRRATPRGAASTGQLQKARGRRRFLTPHAGESSARKFKAPGLAPGASRLGLGSGGSGGAAGEPPAAGPPPQLHSLDGSLLKRLLAGGSRGAMQSSQQGQPPPPQQQQEQCSLPLDSTACADFLVPDVSVPEGPAPAQQQQALQAACIPGHQEGQEQGQQQQQQQQTPADATLLGWRELRQRLLGAGASSAYASEAWARNHYRWVVWKLARLQLALRLAAAAGCGGGGGGPPQLLTAPVVLDELKLRYEREFVRGHRPLLKSVLQGDEPSAKAMTLLVASVHLPPPTQQQQQQQQPQQAQGGARRPDPPPAVTLELTDGWYWVRASGDGPLTHLARRGRIAPGVKLRICGAELASQGPAEPLDAAAAAVLRISANGVHPVPCGARLGRLRQRGSFVPLGRVAEAGGCVPQTLVVVHRIYPTLVCSFFPDSSRVVQTPRQHAAMLRDQEAGEEQLAAEAAAEVQRHELEECSGWLRRGKPGGLSHIERIYASIVEEAAGSGGGGGEGGLAASLNLADQRALRQFMEQRQAALQAQKEEAVRRRRLRLGGVPERSQELVVGEVLHAGEADRRRGGREAWRPALATITHWGPGEQLREQVVEGGVYRVTALEPQLFKKKRGSSELELRSSRRTVWSERAASAAALPPALLCTPQPRLPLTLAQLAGAPPGAVFDFTGLLLGASPRGRELDGNAFQWLFLADHTLTSQLQGQQQQQQQQQGRYPALPLAPAGPPDGLGGEDEAAAASAALVRAAFAAALAAVGEALSANPEPLPPSPLQQVPEGERGPDGEQQEAPWLLAVKLSARAGEVDWLDPGSDTGAVLSLRDLTLAAADHSVRLWNAAGTEYSAVQRCRPAVSGTAARGRAGERGASGDAAAEVAAWAAANSGLAALLGQRVAAVMQSDA